MENLKVARAVSSLDEPSTVMVTEVDEVGQQLNDEEESIVVPATTTTVMFSNADVTSRSHVARGDAEENVREQTPDIPLTFYCCSRDNSPSGKFAVVPAKKVTPEKPRDIAKEDFSQETLSSLSLGDEIDVNKIPVNNTSETESSETCNEPETTVHKRKHSQDELDHEMRINKKARIENCQTKIMNEYKRIMNLIKNQYLPEVPSLFFCGFKFQASYKLELDNASDMPHFVDAALKSGFLHDSQAYSTNEYCTSENVSISRSDETGMEEQSKTEIFHKDEEPAPIVSSPVIISSDDSVANTEQDDSDSDSTNSDVNICNQTEESLRTEKECRLTRISNCYQSCGEKFSIINNQYSDISEDEEETNASLHTASSEKQTGDVTGCHVDKPPPRFSHENVDYNTDAKGKTSQNPKKGKQRIKRSSKKRGMNAKPSDAKIEETAATDAAVNNSISSVGQLSEAKEQGPLFDEDFRRLLAGIVYNILCQIEKGPQIPTITNKVDTTKLPNFSKIKPDLLKYSQKEQSKSPGKENSDHEDVKRKLKQKLNLKKELETQSYVLRTDKQIKTEIPETHFERSLEEEDPDATLWYGFPGPGGVIVKDD